jgi:molybdenum cofactor cytidylyltransferase
MTVVSAESLSSGMVVGLLLASGFGRRFDAAGRRNKLLARLPDGRTLVAASAEALCSVLDHVAVVVPSRGTLLEAALSDLPVRLVRNARAKEGIGASIAVGIASLRNEFPKARGWLVALGDMPFIAPRTIRAVAEALVPSNDDTNARRIVAPVYDGLRGHPVAFGAGLGEELTALQGDIGASVLMRNLAVDVIDCDDPGILRDIDTRDDLSRAASVTDPVSEANRRIRWHP